MDEPICEDGKLVRTETVCCKDGKYACEWGRSNLRVCADKTCVHNDDPCPEDPPPPDTSDAGHQCHVVDYKVCASGQLKVRRGCCAADPLCANDRGIDFHSCPDGTCAYGACPGLTCEADAGGGDSCDGDAGY